MRKRGTRGDIGIAGSAPESYAVVGLRDARGADEALTGVWLTYRGRDLEARLDRTRHEWRVRANGRDLGRVDVLEREDARTGAEVVVGTFFPD